MPVTAPNLSRMGGLDVHVANSTRATALPDGPMDRVESGFFAVTAPCAGREGYGGMSTATGRVSYERDPSWEMRTLYRSG